MFTTNSPPQTHASVCRYPRPLSVAPVGGSKSEETSGFGDPNAPPFLLPSSASRTRAPTLVELENCVRFLSYQSFPLHLTRSLVRKTFCSASPELQPSAPAAFQPARFVVQMSLRFPAQKFPPHPVRLNHPDLPAV